MVDHGLRAMEWLEPWQLGGDRSGRSGSIGP
jgi:hypothetical protein